MKLIKKLLIVTLLVSMLVPVPTESTKRLSTSTTLLSDGNTNTSDYEKDSKNIISPNSIPNVRAI